jgi:hypothetical protein
VRRTPIRHGGGCQANADIVPRKSKRIRDIDQSGVKDHNGHAYIHDGLHGWHGLQRFQAAMPFPNLTAAGEYRGIHPSTLVTQL